MKRILLIEDEPQVRANLCQILTLEGFGVTAAPDGHAGLACAREHHPDLILCDIAMPALDGYGVLRALRADPALADTPFIFLTAKATLADLRSGMDLGADDYLSKPFTAQGLLAAITARLARATLGHTARGTVASAEALERLGLTRREAEVLHWLAQGKSNPEVAIILDLGLSTVKTHVLHIFGKLGVENRSAAILRALEVSSG
jgi:DNA-binding NarL/FixJ family response regulator